MHNDRRIGLPVGFRGPPHEAEKWQWVLVRRRPPSEVVEQDEAVAAGGAVTSIGRCRHQQLAAAASQLLVAHQVVSRSGLAQAQRFHGVLRHDVGPQQRHLQWPVPGGGAVTLGPIEPR